MALPHDWTEKSTWLSEVFLHPFIAEILQTPTWLLMVQHLRDPLLFLWQKYFESAGRNEKYSESGK